MKELERKLKQKQVTLENFSSLILVCQNCGTRWSPNIMPGGSLPKRYWECPYECNSDLGSKKEGEKL